jgi:endonuclease IV
MKVGIKIFPKRIPKIPEYAKIADFIEVMAAPELNPDDLKKFSIPITIHAQHRQFKVNIADKTLEKINLAAVKKAQEVADIVNSDIIILHPGNILNKNCSFENAVNFFNKIDDSRIIIENLTDKTCLCKSPEELSRYKKETGADFCLDFAHVVTAAFNLKKDYKKLVRQFIKLKPVYFHISDGFDNTPKDEHLNFGEGNYDLNFFKQFIGDKRVAIETKNTPLDIYKNQIKFLKTTKGVPKIMK